MAYPVGQDDLDYGMGTVPDSLSAVPGGVNQLVRCTYNEHHMVAVNKYVKHLEGCRKAYLEKGGTNMVVCPYVPYHHVDRSILAKHIILCNGYFKEKMSDQIDPPRLALENEKKERETREKYEKAAAARAVPSKDIQPYSAYYGKDINEDKVVLPPTVTLTDVDGKVLQPKTGKEFKELQTKIAKDLIRKKLMEKSKKPAQKQTTEIKKEKKPVVRVLKTEEKTDVPVQVTTATSSSSSDEFKLTELPTETLEEKIRRNDLI